MKNTTKIFALLAAAYFGTFTPSEAHLPAVHTITARQDPDYLDGFYVAKAVRQEQLDYYYSGQITKTEFNNFVIDGRQGALDEAAAEEAAGNYPDAQWWKGWAAGIGQPLP